MRYTVKGLEIRSENAAKSISQPSKYLRDWLMSLKKMNNVLDYGCGKLRYSVTLSKRCRLLALVDSEVQLKRQQKINNYYCSVYDYSKKQLRNTRIFTPHEFINSSRKYDFALCSNVLSAIPSISARNTVINSIMIKLTGNGSALFVCQYRNSYFSKIAKSSNSFKFLDGWVVKSQHGNSYYGILDKKKIENLLVKHGSKIKESWIHDQSAYVLAGRG